MRILFLLATALSAQQWQSLFDGKNLSAWHDPRSMNPPGDSFTVEDGYIKSQKNPRVREDLLSKESYGDFELSFDWRISPGGNSGVKYRIQDHAWLLGRIPQDFPKFEDQVNATLRGKRKERPSTGYAYVIGFEYQVIDDHGHADAKRGGKSQAGALYDMVGPSQKVAKPVGQFNESRIVVRGKQVEHWLNGVKVVDTRLDDEPVRASVVRRWGPQSPVTDLLTKLPKSSGPISIQNHNDEAWFRNIKIRRLK